jgi:hypothetical protein
MAGKHDVYVYQDPSSGFFKVRPAVAFGSAGDRFSIRNLTDYDVYVTFEAGLMVEGPNPQLIAANTPQVFHIVGGAGGADGFYAYQVSVAVGGDQWDAIGESDPGVIIDP